MHAKRILVTGDRGYIGSVLIPDLLDQGHFVSGIDQRYYEKCAFGAFTPQAFSQHADIRELSLKDLQGYDAVIHLAALSNDPLGDIDPDLTYQINHQATVRLAKLAKTAGVRRFVLSSSCSTYGWSVGALLEEGSLLNPLTPYGKSKAMAEQDLRALACDTFSPVFLRHATVYGLAPMLRFDLVVNNLTAYATTTNMVYLKSDGMSWRPLVHVRDVALSCAAAATAPDDAVHCQVFNIGRSSENYRIRDVADMIAATIPGATVVQAADAEQDFRSYHIDFSKAETSLPGFEPCWTVQAGIDELYRAFVDSDLSGDIFEYPRYSRVAKITSLLDSGALDASLRWRTAEARLA